MNISIILKFIICPSCEGHLQLKGNSRLICQKCKSVFHVIDGIPILIDSTKFNNQERRQQKWFEKHYTEFSKEKYCLENWRESMIRRILEVDFKKKVKTYLDIGCGATGYTTIEAAKRNNWLSFGVDISLEAMTRAKALAKKEGVEEKTAFIVCSAEHLPFKENTFDYVSAISLLEHIENDNIVLKKISQILKDFGYIYICVPNTYKRMWPFLWPIYKYLDYKIGHKRHYSIEGLTNKMPDILKLNKVFYNAHLIKLLQLILGKFHLIDDKRWWVMEKKDINTDFMGIQLNAIYQKI